MIKSIKGKLTQDVFDDTHSKEARKLDVKLHPVARRKLDYIDGAKDLLDLRLPPGNKLEALKGDLKGYHSIRINDQWRIIFLWSDANAEEVEITDYH